jgi:hypothetical protein
VLIVAAEKKKKTKEVKPPPMPYSAEADAWIDGIRREAMDRAMARQEVLY